MNLEAVFHSMSPGNVLFITGQCYSMCKGGIYEKGIGGVGVVYSIYTAS